MVNKRVKKDMFMLKNLLNKINNVEFRDDF